MHTIMLPVYVGIILQHENSVFLIKRHNTNWMQGYWNLPGGLVEKDETILQSAIRETQEEVGVQVNPEDFELVHVIHVRKSETNTQDIVGVYFKAVRWQGNPCNNEPHKITGADWFALDQLPIKITEHAQLALKGLMSGNRYSESGF